MRAFIPALAWAAVVWLIGGLDAVPNAPSGMGLDKVGHFGMYGVLGFLAGRGWASATEGAVRRHKRWPILLVMLVALMGAADEYRQTFVPGRSAEVADWLADALGAGTGFFLALRMTRRRRNVK